MDYRPLISIVIPLYNGSNYVEEALKCALSQDYENVEILVVNDGSTDGGAGRDICMKYADRIRYLEKPNGGCSSALNYGIREAKGEYISWLSHDDLYAPNKLSYQVKLLNREKENRENLIISNRGSLIDGEGNPLMHPSVGENKKLNSLGFFQYLLFHKCVNGCGLLIPKALFMKGLWFDESMRFVLDWNLWLKMAASGARVLLDDAVLVQNRVHGGQVTVKQKALHKTEADRTVQDLILFLQDKPVEYMKELYCFAYASHRPGTEQCAAWLKARGQKVNRSRAFFLRIKGNAKRLMKRVYHAIRN